MHYVILHPSEPLDLRREAPSAMAGVAPGVAEEEAFVPQAPRVPFSYERAQSLEPQGLLLSDGRTLEYWTDGDPGSGPAVVLIHGQWARGDFWIGPPRDDLYLIMPSRPNYGGSSPHPEYNYTSFADDVRQLMDHLGVQRAHVLGGSSGGPCALAIKASLGDRVGRCVLISSDTENSKAEDLSCCGPTGCCSCCLPCCMNSCLAPMLAGLDPEAMWKDVEAGNAKGLDITDAEVKTWKLLGKERMVHGTGSTKAAASGGGLGPTADYILESKPWEGDWVQHLADLDDVELWHGTEDHTVPFSSMQVIANRVPKARTHAVQGYGHDLGLLMLEPRLDELAMLR